MFSIYIDTLKRHNKELMLQVKASRQLSDRLVKWNKELQRLSDIALKWCEELQKELECEKLDSSLREGEANLWLGQYKFLVEQYEALKIQLKGKIPPSSNDKDMEMTSEPSTKEGPESIKHFRCLPETTQENVEIATHCVAVCEKLDAACEWEFHMVHSHKDQMGMCPWPNGWDRHCMAVHVKVNGLDAYTLLDSGCTTILVTHDFGRVAKLKVMQLENPVTLQLGTVWSQSMINFGAWTCLELGTIKEDDTYMDIVNLDRYNMIIGTPFVWMHGLVLDFDKDLIYVRGHATETLTAGQEDLLITKKWARSGPLTMSKKRAPQVAPWLLPQLADPSKWIIIHSSSKRNSPQEGGEESSTQYMGTTRIMNQTNGKHEQPTNVNICCEWWFVKYADILNGAPLEPPPLQEINHKISIIDPDKRYYYHLPQCPEAMKPQLMEKLRQYTDTGWWTAKVVPQAAPLLCIPKTSGKLQTVIDCWQCNKNTIKDVTPLSDQDQIRMDVARVKYRSKIDLSNAYE